MLKTPALILGMPAFFCLRAMQALQVNYLISKIKLSCIIEYFACGDSNPSKKSLDLQAAPAVSFSTEPDSRPSYFASLAFQPRLNKTCQLFHGKLLR
jgi:hypothetical protein